MVVGAEWKLTLPEKAVGVLCLALDLSFVTESAWVYTNPAVSLGLFLYCGGNPACDLSIDTLLAVGLKLVSFLLGQEVDCQRGFPVACRLWPAL